MLQCGKGGSIAPGAALLRPCACSSSCLLLRPCFSLWVVVCMCVCLSVCLTARLSVYRAACSKDEKYISLSIVLYMRVSLSICLPWSIHLSLQPHLYCFRSNVRRLPQPRSLALSCVFFYPLMFEVCILQLMGTPFSPPPPALDSTVYT